MSHRTNRMCTRDINLTVVSRDMGVEPSWDTYPPPIRAAINVCESLQSRSPQILTFLNPFPSSSSLLF
jgi:hypothetical protein